MMNIWIAVLLSSVGASLLGSVILWLALSFWPGSTAGFSGALYLSMVILSSMVVSVSALVLTICGKSHMERVRSYAAGTAIINAAIAGAVLYFSINLFIIVVSSNKGIVEKFFVTGGLLFPICVGAIYGAAFGFVLTRFR